MNVDWVSSVGVYSALKLDACGFVKALRASGPTLKRSVATASQIFSLSISGSSNVSRKFLMSMMCIFPVGASAGKALNSSVNVTDIVLAIEEFVWARIDDRRWC